jgi:hypothetical protein
VSAVGIPLSTSPLPHLPTWNTAQNPNPPKTHPNQGWIYIYIIIIRFSFLVWKFGKFFQNLSNSHFIYIIKNSPKFQSFSFTGAEIKYLENMP